MYKINFVRKRRKELSKIEVQDQQYLRWASYAMGAILILFIITLGIRMTLGVMVSNTNSSINSLKTSISDKRAVEEQYVIFMTKVKILTDLFAQRKEKQEAIAYFSSLFDPNIIISQLSYSADTHTLNFTLSAPSVFDLEKVFLTLRSANVRQKYPSYAVQQLSRDQEGVYGLAINLPLPTRPVGEISQTQSQTGQNDLPKSANTTPVENTQTTTQ